MHFFDEVKNFAFDVASGFRGARIRLDGDVFRFDQRLRRWGAHSELDMFQEMRRYLRPGDTVIDIGANFGLHSLFAASLVGDQGRVYAFEPVPRNLRLLERNIGLNSLEGRIEVEPAALSNTLADYIDFFIPADEVAVTASLAPAGDVTMVKVRNLRLDCWARQHPTPPRLIKIDVEGAEVDVLLGAQQVLRKFHPILLVEVHGFALPSFGKSLDDLTSFLDDLGYREKRLASQSDLPNHYHTVFFA